MQYVRYTKYAKGNMIKMFFSSLLGSIRRNSLTFVLLLALICVAPYLLGVVALIFLAILLVSLLSWFSLVWRVRDAQRTMEHDADARRQSNWYGFGRRQQREGDVTITETDTIQKRVSDDVGEYVDFKEVKEHKPEN